VLMLQTGVPLATLREGVHDNGAEVDCTKLLCSRTIHDFTCSGSWTLGMFVLDGASALMPQ